MSTPENQNEEKNVFIGFVLLSNKSWNKAQFVADLKADWNITFDEGEESANGEYEDTLVAHYNNMTVAISLMPAAVPNGEAEHYAGANYMWEEAVEVAKSHTAHNLVAIMGDDVEPVEKGKLFVKIIATLLKQENALAIYTDGMVQSPELYIDFAEVMKEDEVELPIMNFVWFGFHNDGKTAGVYTYGMRKFGKDEIEMYADAQTTNFEDVHYFLIDIVNYILENDVILQHGETIGMSEEQKCSITRGEGILLPFETLKISIESVE